MDEEEKLTNFRCPHCHRLVMRIKKPNSCPHCKKPFKKTWIELPRSK